MQTDSYQPMVSSLIPPEKMAAYRTAARQRAQQKHDRLQKRHKRGQAIAHQAAALLKQDFQVEKVVLFGSMISGDRIHDYSDVDLAVWGLNPRDLYAAVGRLLALDPGIPIDVVSIEDALPRLQAEIEQTGVVL